VPSETPTNPINPHQSTTAQAESEGHKDKPAPMVPPDASAPVPPPPPQNNCEITVSTRRDWIDWWTLRMEGFGLFVLIVYTVFTGLMWCANKKSADAAKSAADTARDALHISERAYIVDGGASIDISTKSLTIPFVNSGHVPSGAVEIITHEATINAAGPTTSVDLRMAVEKHWGRYNFRSIPQGWPLSLAIPVPQVSKEYLETGRQIVIVAGFVTYNDGFPDTPQQQWSFCTRTSYQTIMKRSLIGPCKPEDDTLHKLELLDGYPNNPEP